jgi:protein dithiol oxidoreductase (disulfide-forming)
VITRRAFTLLTAALAGGSGAWSQAQGKWQPGKHYRLVVHPEPPASSGKVEVTEFFWYGCGHCFALDPALEAWNAKKADFIEFNRVPVIWGQPQVQHAKFFYMLQALNRLDLHGPAFEVIHRGGVPLSATDDVKARAMQFAFLNRHGVTEQQFDMAFDSMPVATNLRRAQSLTHSLSISSVPTIIVAGKFATSVSEAGGESQLLALIDELAAGEKSR